MKISVLIPCHNEEKAIKACVESCLNQTYAPHEIIVVNDGSTDATASILRAFGDRIKVVTIPKATGNKSRAQEYGLQWITGDAFVTTDGDTILCPKFIEKVAKNFKDERIAAVCGYVKSIRHNWLTACREIDWMLAQDLHKLAQSYLNAIVVIPGCAAAFRTDIFKQHLNFEHDTTTEDMDLTFKLHKRSFKIIYNRSAIVHTQDPATLSDYVRQMRRWYGGGWQNLLKHYDAFKRFGNALHLSLTYIEGLVFSILLFTLPFFKPMYVLYFLLAYTAFMFLVGIYASLVRRRLDVLVFSPALTLLFIINAWIFLEQFAVQVVFRRKNLKWHTPARRKNDLALNK